MSEGPTRTETEASPALAAGERDLAFPAFQQPARRAWPRRIALACASIVFMAALAFAGLFLILSRGPIELVFLSDRIARGLEQRIGSAIDVEVGRTVLEKSEDGFSLHVLDIVMKEAQGREILRSPDAIVAFSPLQLLRLNFVPERLSMRGIKLRAEITAEGEVLFSSAGASTSATTRLADVTAAVLGIGSPDAASGWSAISIAEASLRIDDRRNGKQIFFENMNLTFGSPRQGVLEATGSLRKERDIVRFSMLAESEDRGGRRLKLGFSDVGDHVVQALLGAKAPYLRLVSRLSASTDMLIGADGKLQRFAVEATLGRGQIEVAALVPGRLAIDRLRISGGWDAAEPKRATLDARFEGDGFRIGLAGPLAMPESGKDSWRWEAKGSDWVLPPLTARDAPLPVDEIALHLALDPQARKAVFSDVKLKGPSTHLAIAGDMTIEEEGFGLNATVAAEGMPVRAALRWWPSFTSPQSREFMVRTARDGLLNKLSLAVSMPPAVFAKAMRLEALPRQSVNLTAQVENGVMELSEGLPLLTGINGQAQLDAHEAQGTFQRALVENRSGRRLQAAEGTFNLDGLETWYPGARFRFKASGPLDAVAEILRSPDIRSAQTADIDPADVKGQFEGLVALQMPLAATLNAAQVATTVEGRMTGVTIEKAIGNDRLDNGTLTVSTDQTGVEIKGEGRWQGTPVTLSLENDAEVGRRTAVLSLTLDDAAMKRRGFALQGQLQGPLPIKIRRSSERREVARTQVEVDLTRAVIDGLLPGLQKPAGRAGKLSFEALERPNGYLIQNIALDTGPSQVRGQAEATADGTVTAARFSLFRLSPGDNVKLDYERAGGNAKVTIRGNNLDARPFLRTSSQTEAAPRKEGDLELDVKTTLLSGHGGEVMTNAEARIGMRGGQLRQLTMTGRLNGKQISIAGRGGEGPLPVTVESADAGALLRYFDLYGRMMGGALSGQLTVSGRRTAGFIVARNFVLRNEPAIRRLVTEAQTDGARRGPTDTEFSRMRIEFTREGTEIAVKDAVISGAQLGLTFNGIVDPVRDRVSLSGTYVPAYGLNNAFAQIPLVGNILAGGRNEGLLAVTFGVSGKASQPTVSVNPLSAVAPGIFRKIFEFRNDGTSGAPPLSYNPAAN